MLVLLVETQDEIGTPDPPSREIPSKTKEVDHATARFAAGSSHFAVTSGPAVTEIVETVERSFDMARAPGIYVRKDARTSPAFRR